MKYILICLLLTGCARNACEISLDNLQELPKIPKVINIQIDETIKADDGGILLLKNYTSTSHQVSAIKESCK
jgi:hypothetical protein